MHDGRPREGPYEALVLFRSTHHPSLVHARASRLIALPALLIATTPPSEQARDLRQQFFGCFRQLEQFMGATKREARKNGFVTTLGGCAKRASNSQSPGARACALG